MSASKEGHLVLSNIHLNYKKNIYEEKPVGAVSAFTTGNYHCKPLMTDRIVIHMTDGILIHSTPTREQQNNNAQNVCGIILGENTFAWRSVAPPCEKVIFAFERSYTRQVISHLQSENQY